MTTASDKHLQRWGNATYNRVETEREIPKLEIMGIYERLIHLVIGNALKSASSIYSYLARISIW